MKAQDLLERYRIRPGDAIHAATAIENRITSVVSYDKDFDVIHGIERIEP